MSCKSNCFRICFIPKMVDWVISQENVLLSIDSILNRVDRVHGVDRLAIFDKVDSIDTQ